MDNQLNITFGILVIALVLFITDKIPADLVALLVVAALGLTGVLTPQEAFSGFSRSAVITIIAIFILAAALQRTGVTERVGNLLIRYGGKSEGRLVVMVMITGAFLSLFMNNIAAAAVMLPAASGAAKKASVHISRLLMPLAFGTILGGMATLFTTSNILLSSLLHDSDLNGFSVLDFAPVGIPLIVAGIAYIALIGRHSLPGDSMLERTVTPNRSENSDLISAYRLGKNLFRARVPERSFLIGKRLSECTLREDFGVSVVAIEREGQKLLDLSPDTRIERADTLILEGDEADFRRRDVQPYMEFLPTPKWGEEDLESRSIEVVEAMIAPRSRLIGETLRTWRFREKYGVTVLALWRGTEEIITGLTDVQLAFGDALLLQGPRSKLSLMTDNPDIILLMEADKKETFVEGKGLAAIAIFTATLLLAFVLPDLTGPVMLGGAIMMMLSGILTTDQAYSTISWRSVFLVGGMLPMGVALTKTNAAGLMAERLTATVGDFGPFVLAATLFAVTVLLTQAVNGAVVAAIMGPIAIRIAEQQHISPRGMVMCVALAASMAFITPLGHAVNILVMSPGGYKFSDFIKIGFPLTIVLFFVAMIFLRIFWGI